MKALIYILAIVLMAVGAVVALISFFSPGQVVMGLNLGLAATLIAGGVVTLGLAGVITALEDLARRLARLSASTAGKGDAGAAETGIPSSERMAAALGGGAVLTAATAGAAMAATEEAEEPAEEAEEPAPVEREIFISPRAEAEDVIKAAEAVAPEAVETTEETSEDEEAEADAADDAGEEAEEEADEKEADEEETAPAAAAEAAEEAGEEAAEEAGEEAAEEAGEETGEKAGEEAGKEAGEEAGEEEMDVAGLYVVEERVIRGRPARMLSDGTVEAETDEGWMRFENLEHLEEYMEAMSHAR